MPHLVCVVRSVKYLNNKTNLCIIRAPRDTHQTVWNALTFITAIKKREVALKTIHLSGASQIPPVPAV